jgi:hypothetical protein
MELTIGFRMQEYPFTEFLIIVMMCKQAVKKNWRNSENRKIRNVFPRGARTRSAMAKWMSPLDFARQNGLEPILIDFLMER